jgi:hypothetical protein
MRYRLRTLLIVLALGPPVLWVVWFAALVRMTSCPPQVKEYRVPVSGGLRITMPKSPPTLNDP